LLRRFGEVNAEQVACAARVTHRQALRALRALERDGEATSEQRPRYTERGTPHGLIFIRGF
jgi:hypothetical protein